MYVSEKVCGELGITREYAFSEASYTIKDQDGNDATGAMANSPAGGWKHTASNVETPTLYLTPLSNGFLKIIEFSFYVKDTEEVKVTLVNPTNEADVFVQVYL